MTPERSTYLTGAPMHPAAVEAVTELALRLSRVMQPEFVKTWLHTPGIEELDGQCPIDVIARGDIRAVARLVSSLEDPGAT